MLAFDIPYSYIISMYLECINIKRNNYKFYRINVQLSLFGTLLLIRQWGRIGTQKPQQVREEFYDIFSLTRRISAILRRRLRHDYHLLNRELIINLPVDNYTEEINQTIALGDKQVEVSYRIRGFDYRYVARG